MSKENLERAKVELEREISVAVVDQNKLDLKLRIFLNEMSKFPKDTKEYKEYGQWFIQYNQKVKEKLQQQAAPKIYPDLKLNDSVLRELIKISNKFPIGTSLENSFKIFFDISDTVTDVNFKNTLLDFDNFFSMAQYINNYFTGPNDFEKKLVILEALRLTFDAKGSDFLNDYPEIQVLYQIIDNKYNREKMEQLRSKMPTSQILPTTFSRPSAPPPSMAAPPPPPWQQPPIPPKINSQDLPETTLRDGRKVRCLYTQAQLDAVLARLKNPLRKEVGKKEMVRELMDEELFTKGARGFAAMSVTGPDGRTRDYAVYRGKDEQRDVQLGTGTYGRVKYVMNINPADPEFLQWDVVKIQIVCGVNTESDIQREYDMLKEVGQGKGLIKREHSLKLDQKVADNVLKLLEADNKDEAKMKLAMVQAKKQLADEWQRSNSKLAKFIYQLIEDNDTASAKFYLKQASRSGAAKVTEILTVMKYVPGNTLTEIMRQESSGAQPDYLKMAKAVMQAYQRQMRGIVNGQPIQGRRQVFHRDIKPDNIKIDDNGNAEFVDFGTALYTDNVKKERMGSPGYMAPEIFNFKDGDKPSEETEVYSLGVVIGQMVGFYMGPQPDNQLRQITNIEQIIPDEKARKELIKLVQDMTATVPSKRPKFDDCMKRLNQINPALTAGVHAQPQTTPPPKSTPSPKAPSHELQNIAAKMENLQTAFMKLKPDFNDTKIKEFIEMSRETKSLIFNCSELTETLKGKFYAEITAFVKTIREETAQRNLNNPNVSNKPNKLTPGN